MNTSLEARSAPDPADRDKFAQFVADQFCDRGWLKFDAVQRSLGCRKAQLTQAVRYLRANGSEFVVETKVRNGRESIRITKVISNEKVIRQISADILPQLVRVVVSLRHRSKRREEIANDVLSVTDRLAPYCENEEFDRLYQKFQKRVSRPKRRNEYPEDYRESPEQQPDQQLAEPLPLKSGYARLGSIPRIVPLTAVFVLLATVLVVFMTWAWMTIQPRIAAYVDAINAVTTN